MSSTTTWIPSWSASMPSEPERIARRIAIGHEQPDDAFRPERARAQRRHDGAVDPARYPDDGSASAQITKDDLADGRLDLPDHLPRIDPKHIS